MTNQSDADPRTIRGRERAIRRRQDPAPEGLRHLLQRIEQGLPRRGLVPPRKRPGDRPVARQDERQREGRDRAVDRGAFQPGGRGKIAARRCQEDADQDHDHPDIPRDRGEGRAAGRQQEGRHDGVLPVPERLQPDQRQQREQDEERLGHHVRGDLTQGDGGRYGDGSGHCEDARTAVPPEPETRQRDGQTECEGVHEPGRVRRLDSERDEEGQEHGKEGRLRHILLAPPGSAQAVSGGQALGSGQVPHGVPSDCGAVGGGAHQDVRRAENGDGDDEQRAGSEELPRGRLRREESGGPRHFTHRAATTSARSGTVRVADARRPGGSPRCRRTIFPMSPIRARTLSFRVQTIVSESRTPRTEGAPAAGRPGRVAPLSQRSPRHSLGMTAPVPCTRRGRGALEVSRPASRFDGDGAGRSTIGSPPGRERHHRGAGEGRGGMVSPPEPAPADGIPRAPSGRRSPRRAPAVPARRRR